MSEPTIAQQSIEHALLQLQPVEITGLRLIAIHHAKNGDSSLPVHVDIRVRLQVLAEMRKYAYACVEVTTRLQHLGPCPADSPLVEDFAL